MSQIFHCLGNAGSSGIVACAACNFYSASHFAEAGSWPGAVGRGNSIHFRFGCDSGGFYAFEFKGRYGRKCGEPGKSGAQTYGKADIYGGAAPYVYVLPGIKESGAFGRKGVRSGERACFCKRALPGKAYLDVFHQRCGRGYC